MNNCRFCRSTLEHVFLDLGFAPRSNAYLSDLDLCRSELHYPLRLQVCNRCWLVQTEDYSSPSELFGADYPYFSSTSTTWLAHAARFAKTIQDRLALTADSLVIEIAANDGYLLRNFVAAGVPCLGIEPVAGAAEVAEAQKIPILRDFFGYSLGQRLASENRQADLIIGNNVYAHVPDINDFTAGLRIALKPSGTITLEFPHLLRMIENVQFDTVYHEHFSYLSLFTVVQIFNYHGLRVFDVEELSTHGGSLRIFGAHENDIRNTFPSVDRILAEERAKGLLNVAGYRGFQDRVNQIKDDLLIHLIEQKREGRKVAAYGAAAKGNTLLNYAGVRADLLPFVCDAAISKQGKFLPGSHIPIRSPDVLFDQHLDEVIILPWNLAQEIRSQLAELEAFGTRFVTFVPSLSIL